MIFCKRSVTPNGVVDHRNLELSSFALGQSRPTSDVPSLPRAKGHVVLFICNQPLREGVDRPHLADAKALREIGIGTIAIMPNDTETYPEEFLRQHEGNYSRALCQPRMGRDPIASIFFGSEFPKIADEAIGPCYPHAPKLAFLYPPSRRD